MPSRVTDRTPAAGGLPVAISVCVLTVHQGRLAAAVIRNEDENAWTLPRRQLGGRTKNEAKAGAIGSLKTANPIDCDEAAKGCLASIVPPTLANTAFLEQLRTYVFDNEVHIAYVALAADLDQTLAPTPRIRRDLLARVFAIDDIIEAGMLGTDAEHIVRDAVERVRAKLEYTTVGTVLLHEPFTIPELRRIYESVWGVNLHPANFRRKVLGTSGFVKPHEVPPISRVPIAGPQKAIGATSKRTPAALGATGLTVPTGQGAPELFLRGEAVLLHPAILRANQPIPR